MDQQNIQQEINQAGTDRSGMVDVDSIISDIDGKIPSNLRGMYDKLILSGMRIMFDRNSHQMFLDQLDKPGDMPTKMAEGIISLIYMLWERSNKTIPPQLIYPVTVVLTLRAFEFLQRAGEQEATPEVLGEAVSQSVEGVVSRFGFSEDQLLNAVQAQKSGNKRGLINAQPGGK
jgi:hypothetical protein